MAIAAGSPLSDVSAKPRCQAPMLATPDQHLRPPITSVSTLTTKRLVADGKSLRGNGTPAAVKKASGKMEVAKGATMAAASLAAPGTEAGPCGEPCEHTDCAATRKMAETRCEVCTEPIGYERRFYRTVDDQPDMWEHLAHEVCPRVVAHFADQAARRGEGFTVGLLSEDR